MSEFGTIVQIGDVLVSEEVITEYFACDYALCKGCCCVIGDGGAPLEEDEPALLEESYPEASRYMTPQGREAALKSGFFEIDRDGDIVTPVVREPHFVAALDSIPGAGATVGTPGLEDCAFCHYKDGNVLCALERSFREGRSSFCKPRSCRLYPIRVTRIPGGGEALNLHRWSICQAAFQRGRREKIRVYRFLEDVLTEIYGVDFYAALHAAARHILKEDVA